MGASGGCELAELIEGSEAKVPSRRRKKERFRTSRQVASRVNSGHLEMNSSPSPAGGARFRARGSPLRRPPPVIRYQLQPVRPEVVELRKR